MLLKDGLFVIQQFYMNKLQYYVIEMYFLYLRIFGTY